MPTSSTQVILNSWNEGPVYQDLFRDERPFHKGGPFGCPAKESINRVYESWRNASTKKDPARPGEHTRHPQHQPSPIDPSGGPPRPFLPLHRPSRAAGYQHFAFRDSLDPPAALLFCVGTRTARPKRCTATPLSSLLDSWNDKYYGHI